MDRHAEVYALQKLVCQDIISAPDLFAKIIEAGINSTTVAELAHGEAMYGAYNIDYKMMYDCLASELKFNLQTGKTLWIKTNMRIKLLIMMSSMRPTKVSNDKTRAIYDTFSYLLGQTYALSGLAALAPRQMSPEINDPFYKELDEKYAQKIDVKFSTRYLCKCGARKTDTYQIQTRGLDEPGTIFAVCLVCSNKWTL
jgi:DNA-directed RNA polymerase subunit M/transcription elongation factor TFIIS